MWSSTFVGHTGVGALDIDADGNLLLGGHFEGSIDLGGGQLVQGSGTSAGTKDIYIAKLDGVGVHLWSFALGAAQPSDPPPVPTPTIGADASGNVLVTLPFQGSVKFADGPLLTGTVSGNDIATAKLDPAGNHAWSWRSGDMANQNSHIVVEEQGTSVLSGHFNGVLDLPSVAPLSNQSGQYDLFVAKVSAGGTANWARHFAGSDTEVMHGRAATDSSGNIFVAGSFNGSLDFGDGPMSGGGGFAVKLSSAGEPLWSVHLANTRDALSNYSVPLCLATDASDNLLLAGSVAGTVTIGASTLTTAGDEDLFVAKLDPDGQLLWVKQYGDAEHQGCAGIAVVDNGNVVIDMEGNGTTDFGGGPLTTEGGSDIFLVELDPMGEHVWSQRYGGGGDEWAVFDVANDGSIAVAGSFAGSMDFGHGAIASRGPRDLFLARVCR